MGDQRTASCQFIAQVTRLHRSILGPNTTGEVEGLLLTDGRSSVLLRPPEPYPDGQGYRHQIDLAGGPFRGTIDASSSDGSRGLRQFRDQLAVLHQTLRGEARLSPAYENLKLSLQGDGLGHVLVQVDARAGDCMEMKLSFNFVIDWAQLPVIMTGIDQFRGLLASDA